MALCTRLCDLLLSPGIVSHHRSEFSIELVHLDIGPFLLGRFRISYLYIDRIPQRFDSVHRSALYIWRCCGRKCFILQGKYVWMIADWDLFHAQTPILYYRIVAPIRVEYQSIVFFAGNYIYKDSSNAKFQRMLDRRVLQLLTHVLIISGLLFTGYIVFESLPIATFLLTGKRTMVTAVQLPYFDPASDLGYYLNVINQTVLSHFIVFVNIGVDSTFAMIVNSMWAGVDIIRYSVDEMQHNFRQNGNSVEQRRRLRNILIQIQDLDRWLPTLLPKALSAVRQEINFIAYSRLILKWKIVFDDAFLYRPITLAISIALATFCILIVKYLIDSI